MAPVGRLNDIKWLLSIWKLLKWKNDIKWQRSTPASRLYGQFSLAKTLTLQAGATVQPKEICIQISQGRYQLFRIT